MIELTKDNVVEYCKNCIMLFRRQLEITTSDFLSNHLATKLFSELIQYRDPTRNWYCKEIRASLDESAIELIGIDSKTGHYLVTNTTIRDNYIYDILQSFRKVLMDSKGVYPVECSDAELAKILLDEWKNSIKVIYSRENHIKSFIWGLPVFSAYREYVEEVIDFANAILSPNVRLDFNHVMLDGCNFTIINHIPGSVSLDNQAGIFGQFVNYKRHFPILENQKIVKIPKTIKIPGYKFFDIVKISKGVFDSLTEAEEIIIPSVNIDWSFWKCKKLKKITVEYSSRPKLCSIDGVLYDSNKKTLIAYPNCHGNEYTIPNGTETIENLAFKIVTK